MQLRLRLARLCIRLAVILLGAGAIMMLPEPAAGQILYAKNAIVAFVTVILIGKTLFDTLFYDT